MLVLLTIFLSGTTLSALHFVPGQYVDVAAKSYADVICVLYGFFLRPFLLPFSVGKGYAGPMKRWNFRGLRASHGVSVSHRSGGSTGGHQVRMFRSVSTKKTILISSFSCLGSWASMAW